MIGEKVGHYTIKQKLGEGGMGVVYVGEHDVMRKRAAIKVLLPQWTQNAMIVQRFTNEAIAMGALDHPNIVNVHDCGQLPNGSWYIAMEHLEGGTLGSFCSSQGGPLSIHIALQILAQVAAGLEAAHKRGIVHRDLKPENIFLIARKGNQHFAKILDWGISKLGELPGGAVTSTGMIAGTPAYMAPEQMRDFRTVDRRTDVYALGVIAYQMVTGGWLPFQRADRPHEFANLSAPAIHHLQLSEDPIDPRQRVPALDERWANAILAAIHRDAARRPQSARAFILMLAAATPADAYQRSGTDIVNTYADELLEISNLDETVRALKPTDAIKRPPSRYRFGDQLGAGGMAEVFRATQVGAEGFSRAVAVKRVLPGFSTVPQFASMFVQEAKLASLLDHPNIVSVLDFDRDDEGRLFLAMEFVDGRDLASIAATGRLPLPAIIFIITEVLRGLGYAHDLPTAEGPRGLIHRDVSPHNVLLSWEGAVKVSDFGIAKARDASAATASTMIKGKPQYMSPEQANGEPLDGRSDLFAVGIMLWELLTGRRLFDGSTHESLARIVYGNIDPPSSVQRDIPPELDAITMRLLARNKVDRYASAEPAIEDLARCVDAPRNGRGDLGRLLAERFPDAIAARTSRPQLAALPSASPGSQERVTVRENPQVARRGDVAPQPTPIVPWPSRTTLGSAASQSAAPVRPPRSRAPLIGIVIGLAALGGTIVLIGSGKHSEGTAPVPAASPSPNGGSASATSPRETTLTVVTVPVGSHVQLDGTERGIAPLTVVVARGQVRVDATQEGYEPASQLVKVDKNAETITLTLRALPTSIPVDAGTTNPASPPVDARPATRPTKPPRKPGDASKPSSTTKFNPDDAVGD